MVNHSVIEKLIKLLQAWISRTQEPVKITATDLVECSIPVPNHQRNVLSLTLERVWYTTESTVGKLYIDGEFECYILEDFDRISKGRKKVYGKTAIPTGTYNVRLTYSPRFKRSLPTLLNVPGFSGIRIHAGNTAKDTAGCLLPGATRSENFVGQSKRAFNRLYKKLEAARSEGKRIKITIQPM